MKIENNFKGIIGNSPNLSIPTVLVNIIDKYNDWEPIYDNVLKELKKKYDYFSIITRVIMNNCCFFNGSNDPIFTFSDLIDLENLKMIKKKYMFILDDFELNNIH